MPFNKRAALIFPSSASIRQGSAVRLIDIEGDCLGTPDLAVENSQPRIEPALHYAQARCTS